MTSGLAEQIRSAEATEALSGSAVRAPRTRPVRLPAGLIRWLLAGLTVILALGVLAGLGWGFVTTAAPVSVSVDGMMVEVLTHQHTVGELLDEMQVVLYPEDRVTPAPDTALAADSAIVIRRARPVAIHGDSRQRLIRTHATSVADLFDEVGISVGPHDELTLAGEPATVDAPLPAFMLVGGRTLPGVPAVYPWRGTEVAPVEISLRRAVPLAVEGAGLDGTLWTTATTVGEALNRAGVEIFEGDLVTPGQGEPVVAGQHVVVERSLPVALLTRSGELRTRTRRSTVADLLAEQGLVLTGLDRIDPPLDTPLEAGLQVKVTRVERRFEVQEDVTRYVSVWEPDYELEIDNSRLDQEGVNGITRYRYQVTLEDGEPITSTLQDVWLAQEPITKVLKYGTNIVLRDLETDSGPVTYWRKIRMFATAYTPATSGTPKDAPWYGRTRIGLQAGYGVVAVDPSVVRLGSRVYVPGYGAAIAGDTGGGVVGRWIDLGYDDGTARPWGRCVDVYMVGEPPPSYLIRYRLPNTPPVSCLR
ncbi:MAG: ubiquitin-like domain-containing protein [Caldilineales bacterium]